MKEWLLENACALVAELQIVGWDEFRNPDIQEISTSATTGDTRVAESQYVVILETTAHQWNQISF